MRDPIFTFSDGATYDEMMGPWSRRVGEGVLEWMQPDKGLDWVDVGCGSGAFTALVAEECDPASILGVDPSESQLEYARTRRLGDTVRFLIGDAMALPLADRSADVAISALVLHFVPEPLRGVAEMARVVRPGGIVASYTWDLPGGGFPYVALEEPMRALGFPSGEPAHPETGKIEELRRLWEAAGIVDADARQFTVERRYSTFEDYWVIATTTPRMIHALKGVAEDRVHQLKERVRAVVPTEPDGRVIPTARASAIWGRVP